METASRQVFIGQVRWMHARDELIDTDTWLRAARALPAGRTLRCELLHAHTRTLRDRDIAAAPGTAVEPIDPV
jgi:hypothetical protein